MPWWNRRAFARALAVPLILLTSLSLTWKFAVGQLSQLSNWLLFALSLTFFTLFAVTCHRLVLLDPQAVASTVLPKWSWRQTRFALFLLAIWLIYTITFAVVVTMMDNVFVSDTSLGPGGAVEPGRAVVSWIQNVGHVAALYLFARLSLVFPAAAIDEKMTLRSSWALTRSNSLRLFVVIAVLPWIVSYAVGLLYRGEASMLEIVLLTCLSFILLAVEVAALSLSYRELTSPDASAQ